MHNLSDYLLVYSSIHLVYLLSVIIVIYTSLSRKLCIYWIVNSYYIPSSVDICWLDILSQQFESVKNGRDALLGQNKKEKLTHIRLKNNCNNHVSTDEVRVSRKKIIKKEQS